MPKPRKGEKQGDYIKRCIPILIGEGKKSDEASAICHSYWDNKGKFSVNTLDVEILAEGKWNGIDITRKHMEEIVNNFSKLKDVVQVFLKLGHNDEQPLTDGQPALGWVDALRISDAGKLIATFTDLPDIIYNALKKKLYRNVSIEFLMDVKHKGVEYGTILEAVALLGADVPAVNTLADLQAYMSRQDGIDFSSRVEVSTISGSIKKEDSDMDELEKAKARIAALEAENAAKDESIKLSAKSKADNEAKIAELEAKEKAREEESRKVEFARREEAVKSDLEDLVKKKVVTPAKRDELLKEFTADTADRLEFAVEAFKDMAPKGGGKEDDEVGNGKGRGDEEEGTPDDILFARANAMAAEKSISFNAAVARVMASDPKLAREYADMSEEA